MFDRRRNLQPISKMALYGVSTDDLADFLHFHLWRDNLNTHYLPLHIQSPKQNHSKVKVLSVAMSLIVILSTSHVSGCSFPDLQAKLNATMMILKII